MRINCYGCPKDKIYALHNAENRITRFSFSKNLLEYLQRTYLKQGSIQRHTIVLGKPLNKGERTTAKLFAICDRRKGTILRVQTQREYAEYITDDSRFIAEAWIEKGT